MLSKTHGVQTLLHLHLLRETSESVFIRLYACVLLSLLKTLVCALFFKNAYNPDLCGAFVIIKISFVFCFIENKYFTVGTTR